MKATYADFEKWFSYLYRNVGLTDNVLSEAADSLRRQLLASGCEDLMRELGIGFRTWERDGKVFKKEFCYVTGKEKGRALTVNEIENIKYFLPGGCCYRSFANPGKSK